MLLFTRDPITAHRTLRPALQHLAN